MKILSMGRTITLAVLAALLSAVPFQATSAAGPAPVSLGTAATFTILSKSGITDVRASAIKGNVGTSPISGAALLLSCSEVTGTIYVVDAAGPRPCALTAASLLTAAVLDMETAYLDAAGRVTPDFTDLGAGEVGGLNLVPGLYKWGTGLSIGTDVTLTGGPNDVWIFQVAGTLNQANATRITLAGGALAKNVFWQVAGAVTIGTTAHFEGVVLGKTLIAVNTGAAVNGRLLAQTAVTLQQNTVTQPANGSTPPVITPPPHKPPQGGDGKGHGGHGDDGKGQCDDGKGHSDDGKGHGSDGKGRGDDGKGHGDDGKHQGGRRG